MEAAVAKFDVDKLDAIPDPSPATKKQKRQPFSTGLEGMPAGDAARATSSKSMAGRYKRMTITLLPGQIQHVRDLAERERMGLLEFVRWLIDLALQEYEVGRRPELEARVIRGEAKKGHWSSK